MDGLVVRGPRIYRYLSWKYFIIKVVEFSGVRSERVGGGAVNQELIKPILASLPTRLHVPTGDVQSGLVKGLFLISIGV